MILENIKRSRFWPVLAVCGTLGLLCAGARADEVADIYRRLENDPRNATLNLQYAAAAEKAGKLKWALPAYERALSADPGNREAQSGLDRVRKKLQAEAEHP
jgi:predicted TPR repeat methyltransferase